MIIQNNFNSAFADAMKNQLPPALHDPHFIAYEMVRRDQQRTRIYAALALFFWLVGTAGMLLLAIGLDRLVLYLRIGGRMPSHGDDEMLWGTSLIHHSLPFIEGSVVALMLAALFTVLLVFSSRQATLNRINLSLMQISEELKQMRQSPPENKQAGGPA
jgi:hypothetical protein